MWMKKEKSIQGAPDSASRRRISQQLPLISSTNTRNLNARGPGASIHGQGKDDKEKFVRETKDIYAIPAKRMVTSASSFSYPVRRPASCFIR